MKSACLRRVAVVAIAAVLAGCATPPPPDPAAGVPHCYKTNKGTIIGCTSAPAPSLQTDADAKRFAPDPTALTVFVEASIRERALKSRLVADMSVR